MFTTKFNETVFISYKRSRFLAPMMLNLGFMTKKMGLTKTKRYLSFFTISCEFKLEIWLHKYFGPFVWPENKLGDFTYPIGVQQVYYYETQFRNLKNLQSESEMGYLVSCIFNPNWRERGYFYLLVYFGSDLDSWIFIKNFQSFLEVKIDTLPSSLSPIENALRWR